MKIRIYILTFVLLVSNIGFSQSEESFQRQARDDAKMLSTKDYPYIEEFHKGVREKLQGNLEEAIKHFNNCLEIKKNDDAVYFALGGIAKSQKRLSTAQENFEKAYHLDSTNVNYLKELAFLSYDRANFEKAEELFKKLCVHEPRNLDFRYGYASVLIYNKSYQEAIYQLNKLEEQAGIVPDLMFMKADLYKELDQSENVEKSLLTLKENFPENEKVLEHLVQFYQEQEQDEKAVQLLEELVRKDSTNGKATVLLARYYNIANNSEKYKNYFDLLLVNPSVSPEDKLMLLEQRITNFNDTDTALLSISEALLEQYPTNNKVLFKKGSTMASQNQFDKALMYYQKAVESNSGDFEVWKEVLLFESSMSAYGALYEDGQNAMTLFPSLPFVYVMTAEGALYAGLPDEATQILAAGELYILDNQHIKSLFEMRKGEIAFYKKNYKKGITYFEKALALEKNDRIRINYAYGLSKAGIALQIAQEQLDEVDLNTFPVTYTLTKALLAVETKGLTKGIEVLQHAIDSKEVPFKGPLYDLMGDLYVKNNKIEKAKVAWEKAIEFQSQNTIINKKIKEEKFYDPKYD